MFARSSLVALLLTAGGVTAHDLWLLPLTASPVAGKLVLVAANSGDEFPKSEHAADTALFTSRIVVYPNGARGTADARGKSGTSGVMGFTPEKPGLYVLAVQTAPKLITLAADKFNAYLVSDGLPHIYALRAKEKTLDQAGKERYSKSPKLLLRVGEGGPGDATKPVGLTLEIVPLKDPFALKVGDTLPVRVLFQEKPLANAHLGYTHPDAGEGSLGTVRTNAQGEALIPIVKTGLLTIRLTHMTRPKVADYEWESFWTTLTWTLPG